jgi:hypothetical protein
MVPEEAAEPDRHEGETLDSASLNVLMVEGILLEVPLGIVALCFFGNLSAGKTKDVKLDSAALTFGAQSLSIAEFSLNYVRISPKNLRTAS